ncbi:DUF2062 domain-containing protein [Ciceribacter sp. L1K23]|nr:DUF2062 domain-containing protein [Ciceribacter sp. L1K23]
MPFRRRTPARFKDRLRGLIWPRGGLARVFRYFKIRIVRLTASPHAIAAGVAAGIMASWTPFIGFHFLLAFAIAFLLAGNMVAAALGTAFGNPLTFPFIWAATWEIGNRILGETARRGGRHLDLVRLLEHADLKQVWDPVLKPMLIGSIPPALLSGLAIYLLLFLVVRNGQARRRRQLAAGRSKSA